MIVYAFKRWKYNSSLCFNATNLIDLPQWLGSLSTVCVPPVPTSISINTTQEKQLNVAQNISRLTARQFSQVAQGIYVANTCHRAAASDSGRQTLVTIRHKPEDPSTGDCWLTRQMQF